MNQKILILTTLKPDLRAEVDSWDWETGTDNININKAVGLADSGKLGTKYGYPTTPLFAIATGWRLMCPPIEYKKYVANHRYHWWFERED